MRVQPSTPPFAREVCLRCFAGEKGFQFASCRALFASPACSSQFQLSTLLMSSPTDVTAALQALLSQLFPDLADAGPDVTAYLAAGLAEEDDPDADELG